MSSRAESARVTLKFLSPRKGKSKRTSTSGLLLIAAGLLVITIIAFVRPVPMIPTLPVSLLMLGLFPARHQRVVDRTRRLFSEGLRREGPAAGEARHEIHAMVDSRERPHRTRSDPRRIRRRSRRNVSD
ncbi:MAG TPA: phage holin family protein [Roseiarcus sp.]|nr:phage holin family protein [Roseiarcus sp.]